MLFDFCKQGGLELARVVASLLGNCHDIISICIYLYRDWHDTQFSSLDVSVCIRAQTLSHQSKRTVLNRRAHQSLHYLNQTG